MSSDSLVVKSWLQRELKNMAKEFMAILRLNNCINFDFKCSFLLFLLKLLPRLLANFCYSL